MILCDLIEESQNRLKEAGIKNYFLETRWLLSEILNISKTEILLNPQKEISEKELLLFNEIFKKREQRYPLQYLLKKVDFMQLEFEVGEGVLIPRTETELIVDWALSNLKENSKIVEVGSGSGCISVSLAHYREDLNIAALDISKEALFYTQKNTDKILGTNHTLKILQSDVFENFNENVDAIISNPPYITENEMQFLEKELSYEPKLALSSGKDAFLVYKKIALAALKYLNKDGYIILEIGIAKEEAVKKIFKSFRFIKILKDFADIPRVLVFQNS